jgi:N-acetylglutamate synthase-like GNAT family acetyltransferase
MNLRELEYFVLTKEDVVIGLTGIYSYLTDNDDVSWIAWTCVDNDLQGEGFGTRMIEFIINMAKEKGKKYLKVYTDVDESLV